MARPFRFQPPALPEHTLVRPRLVAQLARRWDRRLVAITAGPGFGKTVLLAAALAENAETADQPRGRDVWVSCEPLDESDQHLTEGIAEALGLAPDVGVSGIVDAVWARAPEQVCLVLDDVHEAPRGSPGAALLDRLVNDLPANAHLVLASRDPVPVRLARLAASDQLIRIDEAVLALDPAELAEFAGARGVAVELLASTAGWPALAELTASAQNDLVLDYLWEEVLTRIGPERVEVLARLAVVGGGDEDVISAIAGRPVSVDELLAGVPMVERAQSGWIALHPLWRPALRDLVTPADADSARVEAAAAHERAGRLHDAIEQLAEAEDWDGVLSVLRNAEVEAMTIVDAAEFGRWARMLPPPWQLEPAALLAAGLEAQAQAPLDSLVPFEAAAAGFRSRADVDGELAAIGQDGLVRWWTNDIAGLLALSPRVSELADVSDRARALGAVGAAAVGHMLGDSARVHAALADIERSLAPNWLPTALWLRSTAHRRDGELQRARDDLVAAEALGGGHDRTQLEVANLRIDWLAGKLDGALEGFERIRAQYERQDDRYLQRELALELAVKHAWIGEVDAARHLVAGADELLAETPSALGATLRLIALAAIAVDEGQEAAAAADLLGEGVVAALGAPEAWFWRDRAAIALMHVLVPETRPIWETQPLGPAHRPGIALAEALEAARAGALPRVRELQWPEPGVVRAHLPRRWIVELFVAGTAADNPGPDELLASAGNALRPTLRSIVVTADHTVAPTAKRLLDELPTLPGHRLGIRVLGPLALDRDGDPVEHPDLRRRRVRELLSFLVVHRRVRREEVAEELWPKVDDPGRNLRTTLNYLQRVLQPDRADDERPYFVRADAVWLELAASDLLDVDVWSLDAALDLAAEAERTGSPPAALDAYRVALELWRGDPFADVPYAVWAEAERQRLRSRFTASARRAGELWLAAGSVTEARTAAEAAIHADRWDELSYRLLARCHLADDDRAAARRTIERCSSALAELGVEPDPATGAILTDSD